MRTVLPGFLLFIIGLFSLLSLPAGAQLKSIVYDFDGLDIGATDIPEGEFKFGDLSYEIAATDMGRNDMVGDRCLKLALSWNSGTGSFGRGISRYIEFDRSADRFNFYFYNPSSNNQDATFDVLISDDDDQSNDFSSAADDVWKKTVTIPATTGWRFVEIPLTELIDSNPGGNGVFDLAFTGNQGMLLFVEFKFFKAAGASSNPTFFLDYINFSEGPLPRGNSEFELPAKKASDYCVLGAFTEEEIGAYHLTPLKFENQFSAGPGKKIVFVNTFIHWAYGNSTIPASMPGDAAQKLLNDGYTPILTWEPLFAGYTRLDPVQPRLSNILNGDYDSYIDAFADAVKGLSDTVIIRFMHEFEGDWYPWSIVHNDGDPNKYVNAFRKVVDRFRARGASKVKWMWCVNSDYAPYLHYNWIVKSYPGDSYVDIVATDIYNNHFPVAHPWWRSFRWQTAESYYYLAKYFPNKPLYICEVGCRERFSSENPASESKGEWFARMDKELQSNFTKVRALIFFDGAPDQNWLVNSSQNSIQSLKDNIWSDDYYFRERTPPVSVPREEEESDLIVYPNPNIGDLNIIYASNAPRENFTIRIINSLGQSVYFETQSRPANNFSRKLNIDHLPAGLYVVELWAWEPGNPEKVSLQKRRKLKVQ